MFDLKRLQPSRRIYYVYIFEIYYILAVVTLQINQILIGSNQDDLFLVTSTSIM